MGSKGQIQRNAVLEEFNCKVNKELLTKNYNTKN